jgi:hypothetical protein
MQKVINNRNLRLKIRTPTLSLIIKDAVASTEAKSTTFVASTRVWDEIKHLSVLPDCGNWNGYSSRSISWFPGDNLEDGL